MLKRKTVAQLHTHTHTHMCVKKGNESHRLYVEKGKWTKDIYLVQLVIDLLFIFYIYLFLPICFDFKNFLLLILK